MKKVLIFGGRYAACSNGTILSLPRWVDVRGMAARFLKGRSLKPIIVAEYAYVVIACGPESHKRYAVHRLICEAFHGKSPAGKNDVNHKDCDKGNNVPRNLEWVSRTENQLHAANHGLKPVGIKSHLSKLTERQVQEIRALKGKEFQRVIGRRYGVSQTCISKIHQNKKWKQLKAA